MASNNNQGALLTLGLFCKEIAVPKMSVRYSPSTALLCLVNNRSITKADTVVNGTLITYTPQLLASCRCGVCGLILFHEATFISFAFIISLWFEENKYIGFVLSLALASMMVFFCYTV